MVAIIKFLNGPANRKLGEGRAGSHVLAAGGGVKLKGKAQAIINASRLKALKGAMQSVANVRGTISATLIHGKHRHPSSEKLEKLEPSAQQASMGLVRTKGAGGVRASKLAFAQTSSFKKGVFEPPPEDVLEEGDEDEGDDDTDER